MSTTTLTDINDVFGQAQDGSVAAIIQILNERLSDRGIRTRAVFVENVLELLCEAPTKEQLEQSVIVEDIRKILEHIGPRRIRRVNINSRLVQEQQLLWLEAINRDPDNQLLWAEMITLKQPHWLKRTLRDLRRPKWRVDMPEGASKTDLRQRKSFFSGIMGGLVAALVLSAIGIWFYRQQSLTPVVASDPSTVDPNQSESEAEQLPLPESYDSFARAVRIAEEAAKDGITAESADDWLALAARWQQASDLMAEVPASDQRYAIAQDRVNFYRSNSESLLQKARQAE